MSRVNGKRRETVITDYLLEGEAKNGELGGKKSEKCS